MFGQFLKRSAQLIKDSKLWCIPSQTVLLDSPVLAKLPHLFGVGEGLDLDTFIDLMLVASKKWNYYIKSTWRDCNLAWTEKGQTSLFESHIDRVSSNVTSNFLCKSTLCLVIAWIRIFKLFRINVSIGTSLFSLKITRCLFWMRTMAAGLAWKYNDYLSTIESCSAFIQSRLIILFYYTTSQKVANLRLKAIFNYLS